MASGPAKHANKVSAGVNRGSVGKTGIARSGKWREIRGVVPQAAQMNCCSTFNARSTPIPE